MPHNTVGDEMSAGPNVAFSTGRGRMAPVGALSSSVCRLAATTSQRHSNSHARRISDVH